MTALTKARHRHDFPVALVDRLERRGMPRFAAAFRAGRQTLIDQTDWAKVAAALERRDAAAAVATFPMDVMVQAMLAPIQRAHLWAMAAAAREHARRIPARVHKRRHPSGVLPPLPAFDLANPAAIEAARTYAYDLVTNVTNQTVRAIRTVITAGVSGGNMTVAQQTRILRDVVGLNEQQGTALVAFARGLAEDDDFTDEQLESRVTRQVDAYIKDRAEMIARTETNRAQSSGLSALWDQAVDQGALGADAQRVWIASPDACDICLELDGQTVGLEEEWADGIDQPPAHPNCRCTMGIDDPGAYDDTGDAGDELDEGAD